jgi:hypothetical protein
MLKTFYCFVGIVSVLPILQDKTHEPKIYSDPYPVANSVEIEPMLSSAGAEVVSIRHTLVAHHAGLPSGAGQRRDQGVRESVSAPGNDSETLVLAVVKNYSAGRDLLSPGSYRRFA